MMKKINPSNFYPIKREDVESLPVPTPFTPIFKVALDYFVEYGFHWIVSNASTYGNQWQEDGILYGVYCGAMENIYSLVRSGLLISSSGIVNFKSNPTITETGSGNTSSMTESSPINATIGNITTPSGKGVGTNSYTRNHVRSGYKEDLEAILLQLSAIDKINLIRIIRESFSPYILEYNIVE